MSTSLIMRPAGELTAAQDALLAELAGEGTAWGDFHPIRLRMPSGGQISSFVLSDGDMLKAPVQMVVVAAQRARAWWPTKRTLGNAPLCSAPDGVNGRFDPDSKLVEDALRVAIAHPALTTIDKTAAAGPWACDACPLAQWGSADGRGQACKSMRRLLVVVHGWAAPAILTLPPTSIKPWDLFASGMKQRGIAYFSRWISVDFVPQISAEGTQYAVAQFKVGAVLSKPEAAEIIGLRHQYMDLVRAMEIVPDDYDTEAAPAPTQDADIPF